MKKYSIAFLASGLPFTGNYLKTKSLGGSETGVAYLAKNLAERGHEVFVFCNCQGEEGEYDGVTYLDINTKWENVGVLLPLDVLIVSRVSNKLVDKCRAKSIYFYCQDVIPEDSNIHNQLWQTDRVVLLSDYQKSLWNKTEPRYNPYIFQTRNGVDFDLIKKAKDSCDKVSALPDDKIHFAYTSRPERGLYPLLQMWPKILEEIPNAYLNVCLYESSAMGILPQAKEIIDKCKMEISKYPSSINVIEQGLRKFDLYRLLHNCSALLYPCGFPEISCIAAIEAMATQTLVISTNDFALRDTVGEKNGILINGAPWEEKYKKDFIYAVVENFKKKSYVFNYTNKVASAYKKVIHNYDWKVIAREWENEFDSFFHDRSMSNKQNVIKNLVYNNDLVMALHKSRELKLDTSKIEEEIDKVNNRKIQVEKHYFPGKTPQGITVSQKCLSYLGSKSKQRDNFKIGVLGSKSGDLAAYLCKVIPNSDVYASECHSDSVEESKNFYLKSKESPLTNEEKGRLNYATSLKSYNLYVNFDVIVVDDVLSEFKGVHEYKKVVESFAEEGALIIFINKEGPWDSFEKRSNPYYEPKRLHNFDGNDLKNLFELEEGYVSQQLVSGLTDRDEVLVRWVSSYIYRSSRVYDSSCLQKGYDPKFLKCRPYKGISLCMISKNEEDNISKCLKSVKNIVDQVVLVDTGSTDDTINIAKKIIPSDRLIIGDHQWSDDFSKARNEALPFVNNDWVLWMDCDEELINPRLLSKYLVSTMFPGFVIQQHHLLLDGEFPPDNPIRLFKNIGPKWFGVVHEQAETEMDKSIRPTGFITDVHIAHYGYVDEETRRRKNSKRNLSLMYKDLKVNPDRRLGKFLYARELRNLVKWSLEDCVKFHTEITPQIRDMMREVLTIHLDYFTDREDPIYKYSYSIYQEILKMMVELGIKVRDDVVGTGIKSVPIVFKNEKERDGYEIKTVHFLTEDEYIDFCKNYVRSIGN